MLRYQKAESLSQNAIPLSKESVRVGERSIYTYDIGLSLCVIAHDKKNKRGGIFTCANSANEFQEKSEACLESLISKLSAMGSKQSDLEFLVLGGTNTASWQPSRMEKLFISKKLPVTVSKDIAGSVYRNISIDFRNASITATHQKEDPKHWSPAASSLGINDGNRIFSQNAASGKVANATRFFRETKSFKGLRELVFPEHLERGGRLNLSFWSAACSSGEEAYSYAMYLLRLKERTRAPFNIKISATDINAELVEKAKFGEYEVPNKDIDEYGAYFKKYGKLDKQKVLFGNEVKNVIKFGSFDIRKVPKNHKFRMIVCANVFQYYNDDARMFFVQNFMDALERPGYLYVNNIRREALESLGFSYYPAYGLARIE